MSSIVFFCPAFSIETPGDYIADLIKCFINHGHQLTVIIPSERRYKLEKKIKLFNGYRIIYTRTLNYRGKVNLIEKGLSTLLMGFQFKHTVKKYCKKEMFQLSIFQTLPITYRPAIRYLKRKNSYIYLLHKDFFPQSAIDLGIFLKPNPAYLLFRSIEKRLYAVCDMIGVMTPKNVEYLLGHNPNIDNSKIEVCPNAIKPFDIKVVNLLKKNRNRVREKYNIPKGKVVFIYGGNISRAQGIEFIEDVVSKVQQISDAYVLFIGSGNEFDRLAQIIKSNGVSNAMILNYLPKVEYDQVLAACDVGLVFLDYRFSIANIPSRTLAYLNFGLPVVAATDIFTDYREMIEENEIGLWSPSNDRERFLANIAYYANNQDKLKYYSDNARAYLQKSASIEIPYNIIIKHLHS